MKIDTLPTSGARITSTLCLGASALLIAAASVLSTPSSSLPGGGVRWSADPCVETGQADVCDDNSENASPPDVAPETPFGEGALGDIAAPGYNGGGGERNAGGPRGGDSGGTSGGGGHGGGGGGHGGGR